jgi:DNA-binding GntR family transcriptional regulator
MKIPATNTSLKQTVINHVIKSIVNKHYKPTQHIKETELSHLLNISRAPIREALAQMVSMGILFKVDRVGIFLQKTTSSQVLDTYHTKGLIEGYLSFDFMREHNDDDITQLDSMIKKMKQNISKKNNKQIDIGTKFHKTLLKYSYNKILLNTLELVNTKSEILFFENWSELYTASDIVNRHLAIVDSIKTKQSKAVERIIRDHYIDTGKKIAKIVGKKYE